MGLGEVPRVGKGQEEDAPLGPSEGWVRQTRRGLVWPLHWPSRSRQKVQEEMELYISMERAPLAAPFIPPTPSWSPPKAPDEENWSLSDQRWLRVDLAWG